MYIFFIIIAVIFLDQVSKIYIKYYYLSDIPSKIIKVPEIPRTKSGKIVEIAVKKVIHGETINNKEAIY